MKRFFLPRLRGFRVIDWKKDRRTQELKDAYIKMFGTKEQSAKDDAQERQFRDDSEHRRFVKFEMPRIESFLLKAQAE
jgi:hypothetical protein